MKIMYYVNFLVVLSVSSRLQAALEDAKAFALKSYSYAKLLQDAQTYPNSATLRVAIEQNYPVIVKILLKHNVLVDQASIDLAKKLGRDALVPLLQERLNKTQTGA